MDSAAKKINWYYNTLPKSTKTALDFLSKDLWFKKRTGWYLAGGTALALQAGHRKSVDLDFFIDKDFKEKEVIEYFSKNSQWSTEVEDKGTVYGTLFKAKVSFISYPLFIAKQSFLKHGFIKVLDKQDVAVMKIVALAQRGRKRDFFDLYWCAQNIEPLGNTIRRLPKQYPSVAHNYHHILKSLVYFNDADHDPDPVINFKADWLKVKAFFRKEAALAAKDLMGLM
ncbi:MAG: nucleotidyl transferase AbiEii/AbiGii toxin family protein [Patescibacteria group bacterium]|nr:MAG: nucleotidyl transferase AbiEii/AbiGii toxin family protein [Patescibacteria group bacterium]